MNSQTELLAPAQIEEAYDTIDDLLADAMNGFQRDLSCDQAECRHGLQCMASMGSTLGHLVAFMTIQLTNEQSTMKPYCTRDDYESHCEEHGKLMELISDGARQFIEDRCCVKLTPHLEKILERFREHRETTDALMLALLKA